MERLETNEKDPCCCWFRYDRIRRNKRGPLSSLSCIPMTAPDSPKPRSASFRGKGGTNRCDRRCVGVLQNGEKDSYLWLFFCLAKKIMLSMITSWAGSWQMMSIPDFATETSPYGVKESVHIGSNGSLFGVTSTRQWWKKKNMACIASENKSDRIVRRFFTIQVRISEFERMN